MPFEFDGEKYRKASAHQKVWANKILGELHLAGNESILDLGCGDGVITNQLAEMVPNGEVLGIDASEGMIKTALKSRSHKNVRFELKNINEIKYADKFDFIFSNAALHWILDHKKLLHSTFQALKSKGTIRFNFAGDGNCSFFFKIVKQAMAEPCFKEYFRDFSWPWYMPAIESYKKLAAESEYSNVEIWGENADRHFTNSEEMIKWIDQPSIIPFLKYIPSHERQPFRNHVVEKMITATKQADGTCFETFQRVNIKAAKIHSLHSHTSVWKRVAKKSN